MGSINRWQPQSGHTGDGMDVKMREEKREALEQFDPPGSVDSKLSCPVYGAHDLSGFSLPVFP